MKTVLNILLFIYQLPQVLTAWAMWFFIGDKEVVAKNQYCKAYKCSKMRGSISLGRYIFLSPYGATKPETLLHEGGHVKQSLILGWLYLIVIGLPSILNAWIGFTKCYYDWYPEKWANKIQSLGVDEYCRLKSEGEPQIKFENVEH